MNSIKCPQCDLTDWETAVKCKRCGYHFADLADTHPRQVFRPVPLVAAVEEPAAVPKLEQQQMPARPKNGLAIFSMIIGILAVPPCSLFGAAIVGGLLALAFGMGGFLVGAALVFAAIPTALTCGIVAVRRAASRPHEYGGQGFAIAGIVCSSLSIAFLPILAAIAIPNLLAARRVAYEETAISSIKMIAAAQERIFDESAGHCENLARLKARHLVDPRIEEGDYRGYRLMIVNLPAGGCEVLATPSSPSLGGRSFYYSTDEGVIRAAEKKGRPADVTDPPLQESPRLATKGRV